MSYEGMVRHQDLEFNATYGHMKHIFKRIQTLGCKKNADGEISYYGENPKGMLTYLQIRRCLRRMGVGWNRSLPSNNGSQEEYYDDDVSVLSFNSTGSLHSGHSGGGSVGRSDILATDAQLIMLLTTLVEMEERYRASKIMSEGNSNSSVNSKKYQLDEGLFLPEFIQAYKLIIGGMQSLKSIPIAVESSSEVLCNRLKERTMGMLRPFGPNCKIYNDKSSLSKQGNEDSDALSSNKNSLRNNVKRSSSSSRYGSSGFSNREMKKVMRSKDVTLAKIMEDHELEMDALATSMETLRLQEQRTRVALKKRRKRARFLAMLLGAILIVSGVFVETRRRDFLASEIATGREAERRAEAAHTIGQWKEKKRELEKKLGLMEGKMRYQVNRNNDMEGETNDAEKRMDTMDVKWLIDKAEIERCLASQVKMNDDLKREQLKKVEVDEELIWCRSRLSSQERALNELEHINVDSRDNISSDEKRALVATTRSNKDGGGSGIDDSTTKGLIQKHKPVYLEMKYNKSIRNAMILRQAYSIVGGLAVSALLQGWIVPGVIKLLAPRVIIPPTPVVVPRRGNNVEMQVVDGIFGSSVAFLLVQALVTFLRPL